MSRHEQEPLKSKGKLTSKKILAATAGLALAGGIVAGISVGEEKFNDQVCFSSRSNEALSHRNESIVYWGKILNKNLEKGERGLYNRMMSDVSNNGFTAQKEPGTDQFDEYFAVAFITETYNLANLSDLEFIQDPSVEQLRRWWTGDGKQAGYKYTDYTKIDKKDSREKVIDNIHLGDVLFLGDPGWLNDQNVVLVTKNSVKNGNGKINVIMSNSAIKGDVYSVKDGKLIDAPLPLAGIGSPPDID